MNPFDLLRVSQSSFLVFSHEIICFPGEIWQQLPHVQASQRRGLAGIPGTELGPVASGNDQHSELENHHVIAGKTHDMAIFKIAM